MGRVVPPHCKYTKLFPVSRPCVGLRDLGYSDVLCRIQRSLINGGSLISGSAVKDLVARQNLVNALVVRTHMEDITGDGGIGDGHLGVPCIHETGNQRSVTICDIAANAGIDILGTLTAVDNHIVAGAAYE